MESGLIFDIKRYAIQDGPGIRTTVFFKGCPLSCLWCHNPEGISPSPELMFRKGRCIGCQECLNSCQKKAITFPNGHPAIIRDNCTACPDCSSSCPSEALEIAGKKYTVSQIMNEIEKDKIFFEESGGGVTFSGGEPLSQLPFLKACLGECQKKGIHTTVDTSGYADYNFIHSILDNVNLFLFDLKLINDKKHIQYTGVSNKLILENINKLASFGKRIIIRVPLIQGVNDSSKDIEDLKSFLFTLPSFEQVDLIPFHQISAQKYESLGRTFWNNPDITGRSSPINRIEKELANAGFKVKKGQ